MVCDQRSVRASFQRLNDLLPLGWSMRLILPLHSKCGLSPRLKQVLSREVQPEGLRQEGKVESA
jgi:hypothetical protein